MTIIKAESEVRHFELQEEPGFTIISMSGEGSLLIKLMKIEGEYGQSKSTPVSYPYGWRHDGGIDAC